MSNRVVRRIGSGLRIRPASGGSPFRATLLVAWEVSGLSSCHSMSELISRFTALPAYGTGALIVLLLYALQSEIRLRPQRAGCALVGRIA